MKRLLCAACALLILLVPGCSNGGAGEGNRYEGWSGAEEGEYIGVYLNLSLQDKDKNKVDFYQNFSYANSSLEWYLNIFNSSAITNSQKPARRVPANYTVFLLNDGIPVPFRTEENGEEVMCFQGKLSKPEEEGSRAELHILVDPIAVSMEEDTPLSFVVHLSADIPHEERKLMDTANIIWPINLRAETAEAVRVPQPETVIAKDFPAEKVEGSEGGINLLTKRSESFFPIRDNQKIPQEQNIYIEAETNIKDDPFWVLALVDGKLVNGFEGKYMAEAVSHGTREEGGCGQAFLLDQEVIPREPGDHRVTIFVVCEAARWMEKHSDSGPGKDKYVINFGMDFLYQVQS